MKKFIIITVAIIVLLGALLIGWLVFQKGYASVYVTADDSFRAEEAKHQFATTTNGKLQLTCAPSPGANTYECNGTYTTGNLLQLFIYQENLFDIAEKNNNIDFSSSTDGSFLARMFD